MLGSRDFMETPFSITSYTSDLVKNQQARTLGELIASDPSVRATNPAGGRFEQFTIRGFSLFNSDVAYNGLYGTCRRIRSTWKWLTGSTSSKAPAS